MCVRLLKNAFTERALAGLGAAQNEVAYFSDDEKDPILPNGQRTAACPQV